MRHAMRLGGALALASGLALLVTACADEPGYAHRVNDALKDARLDQIAPIWEAEQNVLRLRGTVLTADEKQLAERVAAETISPHVRVVSEITISMRGAPEPLPVVAEVGDLEKIDERILSDVEALFADQNVWKGRRIEVIVHGGAVKLTGKVLSQDEKDRITEMVARVAGVKDVVNRLEIKAT